MTNGQADKHFIPVARLADLDARGRAVVRVGKEWVALVLAEGRLHAVQQSCPHGGGGLMSEGDQKGCLLYCPLHVWAFDVRTGDSPTHPGERLRIYAVRLIDDEIQVAASASLRAP